MALVVLLSAENTGVGVSQAHDQSISRRGALATLASLSGACFSLGSVQALAREEKKERTPYAAPEWSSDISIEELRSAPACKATRYSRGIPQTCASKIFVDGNGEIHLKSLSFLERTGWMDRWRVTTRGNVPSIKNPTFSDPDIHPSHGSGTLLTVQQGNRPRDIYLSNEHTFRAAHWRLEDKAIYDWHYDLGVLAAEHLHTTPADNTKPPRAQLASDSVSNTNLCSKTIEVVGFGSDLFKFVGTPFKLPISITTAPPTLGLPEQQHLLFGLKIPRGFLRELAEIGGMSGSPIVLAGTRDVVGVVCRIAQRLDGKEPISYLIFTGPNEVRRIVAQAEASL